MTDYNDTPEGLRILAAVNRMYAAKCYETYAETGRDSALRQAELHEACAADKEARAAKGE